MLGQRETERAIQLGYMYSPEEALKVGLVDELVAEENILDAARKEMNKWLKIPSEFYDQFILYVWMSLELQMNIYQFSLET